MMCVLNITFGERHIFKNDNNKQGNRDPHTDLCLREKQLLISVGNFYLIPSVQTQLLLTFVCDN